jgi:hypothetical protein
MLAIRESQVEVFAEEQIRKLEDRATEHIRHSVPSDFSRLGEEQVRQSVRQAIRKADRYGLELEIDVIGYLNLMYVLGFDFDDDRRYPWAAEILENSRYLGSAKIQLLNHRCRREFQRAAGARA